MSDKKLYTEELSEELKELAILMSKFEKDYSKLVDNKERLTAEEQKKLSNMGRSMIQMFNNFEIFMEDKFKEIVEINREIEKLLDSKYKNIDIDDDFALTMDKSELERGKAFTETLSCDYQNYIENLKANREERAESPTSRKM